VLYSNLNIKEKLQEFIHDEVNKSQKPIVLEIALVGNDLASIKYTNLKQNIGKKLGIEVNINNFLENSSDQEFEDCLKTVKQKNSGLIFQLPVPDNLVKFVNQTPENSDVDLLGENSFKLWLKGFLPPTIGAIDLVLKDILSSKNSNIVDLINFKLDLRGKTVAVIGQGTLVGKPLLRYLLDTQATIVSINKDTKNAKDLTKNADILVCAAGSPELVDKSWVNPDTIIIDAATSESSGVLVGDVKKDSLFETNLLVASPSGVGSLTVLYLFLNLVKLSSN